MLVELATPAQHPVITIVNDAGQVVNPVDQAVTTTRATNAGTLESGVAYPDRIFLGLPSNAQVLATGTLSLTYFTAPQTATINSVRTWNGATAAGATPTICRIGIYSVAANGTITLLSAIANDTTLWNTVSTEYVRALTSPFSMVENTRYAYGHLIVTAAAIPTMRGLGLASSSTTNGRLVWGRAPRMSGRVTGQTDLPASVVAASILDWEQLLYLELIP